MVGFLDFSLPRGLFSLLLLQVSMWGSDTFVVIGPSEPIVAMLGAETVLPCHVSPAMSVENMELRWFRSQFSEAVYVYQDGMEQVVEQLVDFKGRAELVKDYITEGRVGVRIHSLRVSDNGIYKCFFKKGGDFEEAILELKVIGLGSGPRILMVGPEDEGIRVTCTGKGWFPQPEVLWKDERGEKISSVSEDETQDDDGLFQIEAALIVRDSSKRKVSCSMKNPFFGEEQVETISIPEPFFPRTSPWKAAFGVSLPILVTLLGAVLFLVWRERQEKKRAWKAEKEKEEESKAKDSLKTELARRKELYQQDWRKANLYADWGKEQFKAVAVSLAPDTAHPNLNLSESRRRVSWVENVPHNCDTPTYQGQGGSETIFSVLGQDCFTTGRHYWEVEVNMGTESGSGTRWAVGVCSDTVKRQGWFVENPEKNFWVVACTEGTIEALTSPPESLSLRQHLHRIGVFLDWDAGDVSFYNMIDGSHIYSFTTITFCGTLRPYFSLQGSGTSLTTCLASDHTENCPDSPPKTSVTHVTNCDVSIPQETNSLLPQ
ncbi:butyrophilin subfamily 1 member A1-like [Trichechus manatus latirostris]|uniref:Butyrophilin subfamily 1 member A1-like n=1 Tax=Trichechus manatus latirostris TaxID=127582 RepID=A0A2Y9EDF9_TRIMA|nr:butyrophilin subfamily 1 member A1-like [Trichechus manatus latirostris]